MLLVFRLLRYVDRLVGLLVGVLCLCRKEGVIIVIFILLGKARFGFR